MDVVSPAVRGTMGGTKEGVSRAGAAASWRGRRSPSSRTRPLGPVGTRSKKVPIIVASVIGVSLVVALLAVLLYLWLRPAKGPTTGGEGSSTTDPKVIRAEDTPTTPAPKVATPKGSGELDFGLSRSDREALGLANADWFYRHTNVGPITEAERSAIAALDAKAEEHDSRPWTPQEWAAVRPRALGALRDSRARGTSGAFEQQLTRGIAMDMTAASLNVSTEQALYLNSENGESQDSNTSSHIMDIEGAVRDLEGVKPHEAIEKVPIDHAQRLIGGLAHKLLEPREVRKIMGPGTKVPDQAVRDVVHRVGTMPACHPNGSWMAKYLEPRALTMNQDQLVEEFEAATVSGPAEAELNAIGPNAHVDYVYAQDTSFVISACQDHLRALQRVTEYQSQEPIAKEWITRNLGTEVDYETITVPEMKKAVGDWFYHQVPKLKEYQEQSAHTKS